MNTETDKGVDGPESQAALRARARDRLELVDVDGDKLVADFAIGRPEYATLVITEGGERAVVQLDADQQGKLAAWLVGEPVPNHPVGEHARCSSCRWWDRSASANAPLAGRAGATPGHCRFNAPQPGGAARWPLTDATDWCAQHSDHQLTITGEPFEFVSIGQREGRFHVDRGRQSQRTDDPLPTAADVERFMPGGEASPCRHPAAARYQVPAHEGTGERCGACGVRL